MESKIIKRIKTGYIAVLPTDTIYGIHAPALNKRSVEKIYQIRGRAPEKPFIILISKISQLSLFKIKISKKEKEILIKYWPGKVSIVLPCPFKEFEYLHRGGETLAFRLPDKKNLLEIINETGPLISTSVNPEGKAPANSIEEAKNYFGNKIDIYIDEGILKSEPSTVIKIENGKVEVLRQGAVKI